MISLTDKFAKPGRASSTSELERTIEGIQLEQKNMTTALNNINHSVSKVHTTTPLPTFSPHSFGTDAAQRYKDNLNPNHYWTKSDGTQCFTSTSIGGTLCVSGTGDLAMHIILTNGTHFDLSKENQQYKEFRKSIPTLKTDTCQVAFKMFYDALQQKAACCGIFILPYFLLNR